MRSDAPVVIHHELSLVVALCQLGELVPAAGGEQPAMADVGELDQADSVHALQNAPPPDLRKGTRSTRKALPRPFRHGTRRALPHMQPTATPLHPQRLPSATPPVRG